MSRKSLKRTFQTGFWVNNHLLHLSCSDMISQRLFVVEKQVLNVRIKAFWYTKVFFNCFKQYLWWYKNHCSLYLYTEIVEFYNIAMILPHHNPFSSSQNWFSLDILKNACFISTSYKTPMYVIVYTKGENFRHLVVCREFQF